MEKGDEEIRFGLFQIRLQPLPHGTGGITGEIVGVQTDEVGFAEIEGVIRFGPTGTSAGLAFGRGDITIIIRSKAAETAGVAPLVVSHGGPANGIAQGFGIGFEKVSLEFGVQAGAIGHIADVEVAIEGAFFLIKPIAQGSVDFGLDLVSSAAVTDHPEQAIPGAAGRGQGAEGIVRAGWIEGLAVIGDGIIIKGIRLQPGKASFILPGIFRCRSQGAPGC